MFKQNEHAGKSFRGLNPLPSKVGIQYSTTGDEPKISTTAVLGSVNRFPYSSTPAVSPSQNLKTTKKELSAVFNNPKKNLKQSVISRQLDSSSGDKSTMHTPFVGDCSAVISPIRGGENNPGVCLTQQKQGHLRSDINSEECSIIASNRRLAQGGDIIGMMPRLSSTMISQTGHLSGDAVGKVPYPFPDVTAYDNLNRDDVLFNSLRILRTVRMIEIEKEKYEEKKKGVTQQTGRGNKKKGLKTEERAPGFLFTKDMFHSINSQACLHVLHLLFESYDSKEAEDVFRDVWPVYDKKLEGVFRRVALKWLREIIEAHPSFFTAIKLEALSGLLVNPGGERFIQLIECFIKLVLFRIAKGNEGSENMVLNKPNLSDDSEVTNRQILVLEVKTQNIVSQTFLFRKQMLQNSLETERRVKLFQTRKQSWLNKRNDIMQEVDSLLLSHFGQLVQNLDVVNLSDEFPFSQPKDSLLLSHNSVVDKALEAQTAEALMLLNTLGGSVNKFRRLWFILSMDMDQERLLDGSRLFFLDNNGDTSPSMKDFIRSVHFIGNAFIQDKSFNAPVPNSILKEYKSTLLKFDYLKLIQQDMKKQSSTNDLGSLRENLDMERNVLKLKLKDVDWREFSKVDDGKLTTDLLITPTKGIDFFKKTGHTPGLLNFLNTGISGVSDEPHPGPSEFSMSNISSSQINELQNKCISSNNKCLDGVTEMTDPCLTPVSRFNSSSVDQRHPPLRTRLSGVVRPRVSFHENPSCTNPPVTVTVTVTSETEDLNNSKLESSFLNASVGDVSMSDVSVRSENSTPIGLVNQARIARIMGSLNSNASRSSTQESEQEDSNENSASDAVDNSPTVTNVSLRKSLIETKNRVLICSVRSQSEFNRSLMDEWNDEKGIMDMSFNEALDDSDSESL